MHGGFAALACAAALDRSQGPTCPRGHRSHARTHSVANRLQLLGGQSKAGVVGPSGEHHPQYRAITTKQWCTGIPWPHCGSQQTGIYFGHCVRGSEKRPFA